MFRSDTLRPLTFALLALPALLGGTVLLTQPATALIRQDEKKQDDKKVEEKKDETAYVLKRVHMKGDKSRYKTNFVMKADNNSVLGGGVAMSLLLVEKVTKVDSEGGVTLTIEFEEANGKFGEIETDITSMLPKITRTLDAKGNVTKMDMEGGTAPFSDKGSDQAAMLAGTEMNFFPDKPIKVGDTWEYEFNAPGTDLKSAKPKRRGKATLLGKETVKGIETLKIKTESEVDIPKSVSANAGKMKISSFNFVEISTGRPVKTEVSISGSAGELGKTNIELKTELVTDADKKTPKDVKTKE